MRKLLTILFLLVNTIAFGQNWNNTGTANLQRAPTSKGYIYRNNMGVLGNVQWYTQQQIDSLFTVSGVNIYNSNGTLTGDRLLNLNSHQINFSQLTGQYPTNLNIQSSQILATTQDTISGDNTNVTVSVDESNMSISNLSGTNNAQVFLSGGTSSGNPYKAELSILSNSKYRGFRNVGNVRGIAVEDSISGLGLQGTRKFNYAISNGKTFIQRHALDSVSKAKADSVKNTIPALDSTKFILSGGTTNSRANIILSTGSFNTTIGDFAGGGAFLQMNPSAHFIGLSTGLAATYSGTVNINDTNMLFGIQLNSKSFGSSFNITPGNQTFTDQLNDKGPILAGNYHANKSPRGLTDYGYVDSLNSISLSDTSLFARRAGPNTFTGINKFLGTQTFFGTTSEPANGFNGKAVFYNDQNGWTNIEIDNPNSGNGNMARAGLVIRGSRRPDIDGATNHRIIQLTLEDTLAFGPSVNDLAILSSGGAVSKGFMWYADLGNLMSSVSKPGANGTPFYFPNFFIPDANPTAHYTSPGVGIGTRQVGLLGDGDAVTILAGGYGAFGHTSALELATKNANTSNFTVGQIAAFADTTSGKIAGIDFITNATTKNSGIINLVTDSAGTDKHITVDNQNIYDQNSKYFVKNSATGVLGYVPYYTSNSNFQAPGSMYFDGTSYHLGTISDPTLNNEPLIIGANQNSTFYSSLFFNNSLGANAAVVAPTLVNGNGTQVITSLNSHLNATHPDRFEILNAVGDIVLGAGGATGLTVNTDKTITPEVYASGTAGTDSVLVSHGRKIGHISPGYYAPNVLTGYTSSAGTVSATDNVLQAIQKLNGNIGGLSSIYQPLENQRLSTTNSPSFAEGTYTGDLTLYRSGTPTVGVLFMNQAQTAYLENTSSGFSFNGGNLLVNGNLGATLPAYSSGTNLSVVYNSTNNRFETNSALGGTVTSVTSANTDIGVATGTTTPVLTFNRASITGNNLTYTATQSYNTDITFLGGHSAFFQNTAGTFNFQVNAASITATRAGTLPDFGGQFAMTTGSLSAGVAKFNSTGQLIPAVAGTDYAGIPTSNTFTGVNTFNSSVTASSGLAKGNIITGTLTAAANNDILTALYIAPTFSLGAFTGVTSAAIEVAGDFIPATNSSFNFGSNTLGWNNAYMNSLHVSNLVGTGGGIGSLNITTGGSTADVIFSLNSTSLPIVHFFNTTGNVMMKNGGTFTDNTTDRLQVNGSIISGNPGTSTGAVRFGGATSGTITIQPQAAAGTYNKNLATTAGTLGQVETSGGGGSAAETWSSVAIMQATADLTAQTAAVTITTFTVGASTATFNIAAYLNVTAVTVDVIETQVTYTDENSTSQTVTLFNQGATSALLSSIGNSTYPPVTIRAKNATTITVKSTLTTGTGSIAYDAGARISQL